MPKTLNQKRQEASEREENYSLRSIEDQLDLLDKRPGESARERGKLMRVLNDANTRPKK